MKKILFITHDTSRSGAPFVLLHFMRWLKEHHEDIKMDVLALRGGDLKGSFIEVASEFHELKQQPYLFNIFKKAFLQWFGKRGETVSSNGLIRKLARKNPDLIYANSVSAIPVGVQIKEQIPKTSFVAHIHELQTVIDIVLPDLLNFVPSVDLFFAVSQMVQKNLVENYQIPNERVRTIYECATVTESGLNVKKTKGIRVGSSGTFHWRKGNDVFLQVIRYLKKHYPELDIEFIWIGALPKMERTIAEADIKKMGLEDMILFTGSQKDPEQYYKDLDVFLLPSREDPFPLVCIEVGMLGIPIICFEQATGTAEILYNGGGAVVPYLDVAAMAEQIALYCQQPEKRICDGKRSRELFSRFTPEKICPEIFKHLQSAVAS